MQIDNLQPLIKLEKPRYDVTYVNKSNRNYEMWCTLVYHIHVWVSLKSDDWLHNSFTIVPNSILIVIVNFTFWAIRNGGWCSLTTLIAHPLPFEVSTQKVLMHKRVFWISWSTFCFQSILLRSLNILPFASYQISSNLFISFLVTGTKLRSHWS